MSGCQVTGTGPSHLCGKDEECLHSPMAKRPCPRTRLRERNRDDESTGRGKVRSWAWEKCGPIQWLHGGQDAVDARCGTASRGLSDLRADLSREAARVPELR